MLSRGTSEGRDDGKRTHRTYGGCPKFVTVAKAVSVPVVSTVTVVVDWIGMEFPHVSGGGRSAFGWLPQLTCI